MLHIYNKKQQVVRTYLLTLGLGLELGHTPSVFSQGTNRILRIRNISCFITTTFIGKPASPRFVREPRQFLFLVDQAAGIFINIETASVKLQRKRAGVCETVTGSG